MVSIAMMFPTCSVKGSGYSRLQKQQASWAVESCSWFTTYVSDYLSNLSIALPFAIVVPQSAKCWSQTQCKFTRPPSVWKGLVPRLLSAMLVASYPGSVGGERQPCIDCLNMCDNSQKNLGIRLRLEIEYIFLSWRYMYSCLLTFNSKAKMLSCGYQLVSVSWYATRCCHLRVWV